MNEEKNIDLAKVKVNRTKAKPTGKARAKKSPFGLSDNLKIAPAGPVASFKIKTEPAAVKTADSRKIYRRLAFSFVALTLILAAVVLYFGLAKLTIVIIPAQEKITDSSTVEIVSQAGGVPASGQIYGIVKQVPVEQSREFSAGGQETLGQEVSGKVVIVNNYVKNQPLVATTRLLSFDNKIFRLKNTVNVPAGGRLETEVYADEAKPEMAVGPGKFTIPGLWAGLQDKIYAESKEPMKYNQKIKYFIEQSDIDKAVKELKNELLTNAKIKVKEAYRDYAQAIFAVDDNSVSQEISGKVGEVKEKFNIKMKIMATIVAFNDEEIYEQVKAKIAAALADDKEISKFNKEDMSYTLENFNLAQNSAVVKVNSTAQAALKDGTKIIKKNNLAGLSYEQIKAYLNGLPEVAGYKIEFFPSFVQRAPDLSDRIRVEIKK